MCGLAHAGRSSGPRQVTSLRVRGATCAARSCAFCEDRASSAAPSARRRGPGCCRPRGALVGRASRTTSAAGGDDRRLRADVTTRAADPRSPDVEAPPCSLCLLLVGRRWYDAAVLTDAALRVRRHAYVHSCPACFRPAPPTSSSPRLLPATTYSAPCIGPLPPTRSAVPCPPAVPRRCRGQPAGRPRTVTEPRDSRGLVGCCVTPSLRIQEIAYRVGFDDPLVLPRAFIKRRQGEAADGLPQPRTRPRALTVMPPFSGARRRTSQATFRACRPLTKARRAGRSRLVCAGQLGRRGVLEEHARVRAGARARPSPAAGSRRGPACPRA